MWIDGKYMSETEISAYIKQVKQDAYREGYLKGVDTISKKLSAEMSQLDREKNAYKQELIDTLKKATICIMGDRDCDGCMYEYCPGECPTQLRTYVAKLRLEELK